MYCGIPLGAGVVVITDDRRSKHKTCILAAE